MKSLTYFHSDSLEVKGYTIMGGNDIPPCTPNYTGLSEEERKKLEELLNRLNS